MSKSKPKLSVRRFNEDRVAELEARAEGIATKTPGARRLEPVESVAELAEAAALEPPEPADKSKSASKLRRDDFVGERLSAYIDPDLATKLRVRCAMERRSISDAVTEALERWLD